VMRKLTGPMMIILSLGLAVSMTVTSKAANTEYRHMIVDSFAEGAGSGSEVSAMPEDVVQKIINNQETDWRQARRSCDTYISGDCTNADTAYSLRIYLPLCGAEATSYCIESLAISDGVGGPLVKGDSVGLVDGKTFDAASERGLPKAVTASRWTVPGVKHSGGSDAYAVKVLVDAFKSGKSKDLFLFDVTAIVEPFTESKSVQGQSDDSCTSFKLKDSCAKRVDFLEKQRIALTLRLPSAVTGWLNGRLKNAAIEITSIDSKLNRIKVEAEPVVVPEVNVLLTKEQFDSLPDPSFFLRQGEIWNSVNAGNPIALEWIKQLAGVMKDTATGEHTSWAFSTVGGRQSNDCFNDKTRLIGLVTTNAAVYSPGAPDFVNDFLNYKVGGLHYRPDGKSLNVGTYDLLIRSDVARCLYRFTNAPLSASVSVVDDAGSEKRIETTFLNEKDGWLHLGAYGFSFSRPTLKVKLSGTRQSSSAQGSSQETSTDPKAKKQSANYTVKCKKGKVTKKFITAVPKCPSGWTKV
jgi:hypothetical protein